MRETVGKSFHGSRNGIIVFERGSGDGPLVCVEDNATPAGGLRPIRSECRFVPVLFKNREVGAWSG